MTLLHLITAEDWAATEHAIRPRPGIGFVHLSAREQVRIPANRLFAGRADVLLLEIDVDGLDVRWEPGVPGDHEQMLFPHVYEPIPLSAVRAVRPYLPGPAGFTDPDL